MSTLTEIRGDTDEQPDLFYWAKFNGCPYYFFAGIDPTNAQYGSFAWTLPAGYTAVKGMGLPDEQLTQSLPDIIGGIASAERITLRLMDFVNGAGVNVLSRLFSPGIATSTPGGYFELASDIPASMTTGGAVSVRSGTVTPANGFYSVGSETLELNSWAAPVNGIAEGNITGGRNRFPCSSIFPVIPYHRIVKNETDGAAIGRNILVTPYDTPFSMEGRTAAFYIGAMAPNGMPLSEADGMLRLVGRIKSVTDVEGAVAYDVEIESIVDDLESALAAPGLGVARIKDDQICLPGPAANWNWLEFDIVFGNETGSVYHSFHIQIDDTGITDNIFSIGVLVELINVQLAAAVMSWVHALHAVIMDVDGESRVAFYSIGSTQVIVGGDQSPRLYSLRAARWSVLSALGFDIPIDEFWITISEEVTTAADPATRIFRAVASRPYPNVFIPVTVPRLADPVKFWVQGQDGSTSQNFFTDQGDGRAFVQFGDGAIVNLVAQGTGAGGRYLTTGSRFRGAVTLAAERADKNLEVPYYYVPHGTKGTVRQVVVAGDRSQEVDAGLMVGRFIASHDEETALDDLNYYPEGVGRGWYRIMDRDSFLAISAYGKSYPREAIVDNTTKLVDLLMPILKEYGCALVWDPETARIQIRALRLPAAPGAHEIILDDSNRTNISDVTTTRTDPTNIRTQWGLKWGWDATEKKYLGTEIHLTDGIVVSTDVATKPETIEDKTLVLGSELDAMDVLVACMMTRGDLYRAAWKKCSRTFNRVGLTLAPGSYHQVVDISYEIPGNTASRIVGGLINPFTGRRGIAASDAVYAMLMSVTGNPQQPQSGTCQFLLNKHTPSSFVRMWSPSGLVDYAAPNRGYDTVTGILTMDRRYTKHATNDDGDAFHVGDGVAMVVRDGGGTLNGGFTVSAVAADGSTVTIDPGGSPIPADTEILLVLMDYAHASTTAARKASVAYQGSETAMVIGGTADANVRWG